VVIGQIVLSGGQCYEVLSSSIIPTSFVGTLLSSGTTCGSCTATYLCKSPS
jgi:hypothetical protein